MQFHAYEIMRQLRNLTKKQRFMQDQVSHLETNFHASKELQVDYKLELAGILNLFYNINITFHAYTNKYEVMLIYLFFNILSLI